MTASSALAGLKVVDLGVGMAAALVAQMLAGSGARVHRVAPGGGDPFEHVYPAYAIWRRGQSMEGEGVSESQIHALLADADVCILGGEDFPGLANPLDPEALSSAHPGLVVLNISGYPRDAGLDGGKAVDILVQARTGLAFEHYSDKPILMAYEPANYGAALHGVAGLLAALYEREGSGRGQVVHASLFEGALTYGAYFWADIERPAPAATFVIPKDPYPLVFECADGKYIHIVLGSAGSKYKLYQVLGIDDPTIDPNDSGLPQLGVPPEKFFGDVELLGSYARNFTRDALLKAIWEAGIPAEPVFEPGECWSDPQIAQGGLIQSNDRGQRFIGMPMAVRWSGAGAGKTVDPDPARGPLAGVKVVDFGAFVAGPYASAILADFGAEVVKVEAPPMGDPNRASIPSFVSVNRNKKSIVMDLKSPVAREMARNLCFDADVVMNNFRTGVSSRLGVDAASLHQAAPHLIVLENSAFGPTGPKAQNPGFDPIIQAYCGLEARAGGEGNPPLWSRTVMVDYTAGILGAISILLGLYHRLKTGQGAEINMPLVNAGIFLSSDLVQQPDGSFQGFAPINRAQRGRHPAECIYQTRDGWLAVAARDEAMARRLAQVLGLEGQLGKARAAWGETEFECIARAMVARSTADLDAAFRGQDVWAEPCKQDAFRDYFTQQELLDRGTLWVENNPEFGRMKRIGRLVSFSRSGMQNTKTFPRLGEHSREVLVEAGVASQDIEAYISQGIVFSAS